MTDTAYHVLPSGLRLAYRLTPGTGPTLVFLPGYLSDMAGGKAGAVEAWARDSGRAALLLDYSGCGLSDGTFADGTLSRWRGEVAELIGAVTTGPVVLVGSSMGGWLMLLLAAMPGSRVAGLVGIAAAPDFTDWGYTAEHKAQLARGETVFEDNPYGPDPTPTHAAFWADGEASRVLDRGVAFTGPVRLLHGQRDPDVPWEIGLRLAEALHSAQVQVTLIKDGDHRLSRPADIALLLGTLGALVAHIEGLPA